jgi:hypothetical protein
VHYANDRRGAFPHTPLLQHEHLHQTTHPARVISDVAIAADKARKIQEALVDVTDEGRQIDIIARQRGYFMPDEDSAFYATVQEYMTSKLNLKQATIKLLSPIDKAILADKKNLNLMDLCSALYTLPSARHTETEKVTRSSSSL